MNLVLLCGDVLQNPGPATLKCFKCSKTIRKNQGRTTWVGCTQPYHLKCLSAEFEYSSKCDMRFNNAKDPMPHEDLIKTAIHGFAELSEAVNQRGLKFLHQNIRSLRGKMDELNILVSHCPNLHILAFTETWLDNSISDGEVCLPGYSIFRSDQTNGRGGGIAVYVKETLFVIRRADLEKDFVGESVCGWNYFYPRRKDGVPGMMCAVKGM